MGDALLCFQQVTWQRLLTFAVTGDNVTVSGNCCNLERCFIADDGIYCREIWLVVQQGCKYVILAPLHIL